MTIKPKKDINPFDDVAALMPADIPGEFYKTDNPYVKCTQAWFAKGIAASGLKTKPNVRRGHAVQHMKTIMCSWEPAHEDKIAAVAYLMSQWFDLV